MLQSNLFGVPTFSYRKYIFTYMYPTCAGKKLFVKHWLIPVSTKQTPAIQSGSLPVNIKGALDLMHQGGDMITKCGSITPDLHLN